MNQQRACFALLPVLLCGSLTLSAQQAPDQIKFGSVTLTGTIRDRIEGWDWFRPSSTAYSSKYTFDDAFIRIGLSQNLKPLDWTFEMDAPALFGLPGNAVAPGAQGQLGQGASYYVANSKKTDTALAFPSKAFLRFHKVFGAEGSTLQLGRFDFQDGGEVVSKDPTVAAVKRDRIQQRLIGPFTFTDVMRAFDGFHYAYDKLNVNYTLIGAVPTRGVFQVDGWGWTDVTFGYASITRQLHPHATTAEFRLFGIYYDDFRTGVVKVDNRAAAAKAADHASIAIWTYGAHYVSATKTSAGVFDVMGEFALQNGNWGAERQRAGMYDFEAGFQPSGMGRLRPWIRGGYYFGSGDKNPNDNVHGTFFQLLPTARPYARFPFFDMMNNVDRFGIITLRPHPRFTIHSEAHSMRLASGSDLWYLGGGEFQPWTFGYQGRQGNGAQSFANLYDVNIDISVNPHFTVTPYYGYAQGKEVIRSIYPNGKDGHLAFLEGIYRF